MPEPENPQPTAAPRHDAGGHAPPGERMPGATTPTWEIELLVSGAVVFSLLRMPGALDTLFQQWSPRLVAEWLTLMFLAYVYLKAAVLALVFTFIAHLIMRGYWVALVGLRSVFPDGVRWDKLRGGPAYRHEAQRVTPKLIELIDSTDNRASLIFAFGAMLVLMALMSFVYVAPAMAISSLVVYLTDLRWDHVFLFVLTATFVPLLLTMSIDTLVGKRIRQDGWIGRAVRRAYRLYNALPGTRLLNSMMLTFTSNVGPRKGMAMVLVAVWAVIAMAMYSALVARGSATVGNYAYLPDGPGVRQLDARHYERTRTRGLRYSTMPFIPDDIVSGPYVRLFVPYDPNRHGFAMETRCGTVGDPPDDDATPEVDAAWRAGVLECLQGFQPIMLDGVVIDAPFEFATDPRSGLRGMVAYIPVSTLAAGRHEIVLPRLPGRMRTPGDKTAADGSEAQKPDPPYRIPFWR